jgi:predicted RNase H-like nuclease (RuvC/YqgF family)
MSDIVVEKTAVQIAAEGLAAVELRQAEISARLDAIPGELAALRDDMGAARVKGSPTKAIHAKIAGLEEEKAELTEELKAIQPSAEKAAHELHKARKAAAHEKHKGLGKECIQRGKDIYRLLDLLHIQLSELSEIQHQMIEAEHIAGDVSANAQPDTVVIPVENVWKHIDQALLAVENSNIPYYNNMRDNLALAGFKQYDRQAEFGGRAEIKR